MQCTHASAGLRARVRWAARSRLLLGFVLALFFAGATIATLPPSPVLALDNGLARTPPMGWNSWNFFGKNISEQLIREVADAMVSAGMKDAGYEYVILDDYWMAPTRDAQGRLQADPAKFPHGIKALADYVHSKGLKLGIYSSAGQYTCQGLPASLGHEEIDAQTFASWGVDYLKYDYCYSEQSYSEIDKITVRRHADRSDGEPVAEIEAEAPGNLVSGNAAVRFRPTASGKKIVAGIGEGSGVLQFSDVKVPAAGSYDLVVTYVHSKNPFNPQSVFVQVNDGPSVRLRLINTERKPNVVNSITLPVTLLAGSNTIRFFNPYTTRDITIQNYTAMSQALQATGRPIVFALCEWGTNQPWLWGADVGHLWRTTGDIEDRWDSVLSILDRQVGLEKYAGPGHWNDPDMLEVGNRGLSEVEARAHFSLWAILAAPLIAGNDIRNMSAATRTILTNGDVIAVDQDPLGASGTKMRDDGDHELWVKPLANGDRAVVLFNRSATPATMSFTPTEIGLSNAASYAVRDLWTHQEQVVAVNSNGGGPAGAAAPASASIAAEVPAHGVVMFRVRALAG